MERRAAAAKQALDRNPNADIAGMSQALDRLLPEPEEKKHYGVPGTMTPILGPDGKPTGKSMYWQSTTGGTPLDDPKETDGDLSIKTVKGEDGSEIKVVVDAEGEVVPSATTALHRGSAQDDPFKGLSSQNQSYAAGQARQYWKLMREKQLLEQDMRDHGRSAEDDVYATDGSIGRDPSYQEEFDEIDNRLTRIREALQSFRLRIDDFDQRGNYTHRPGDMSFDAFQRDTR